MGWKIERISTKERILQKINSELASPVVIVVFSMDRIFIKNVCDIVNKRVANLNVICECATSWALHIAKTSLQAKKNVLFMMAACDVMHRSERHLAVAKLREYGAKTIIGIVGLEILRDPVTADGLDYLISVS